MNLRKVSLYLWPIVVFFIINFLCFYPDYFGRTIVRTDSIQGVAKTQGRIEYEEKNNETYIWNPGQFSGMPLLYGVKSKANLWAKINKFFRQGPGKDAGLFLGFMLMGYIMSLLLGFTPLEGALLGVMVAFPLTNIIIWKVGHFYKVQTLIYVSLMVAGVFLLYEKKRYVWGLLVMAIAMAIEFGMKHPQMTYYAFMIFGVYGIFKLVEIIKEKDYTHLWKATGSLLLAIMIGLGAGLTTIWSMKVHADASMRGKPILKKEKKSEQSSSSEVDGLDWEYAMQWSNGVEDVISTYIPGFSGGSGNEKVGVKSDSYKRYKIDRAPLYWGKLPFTASPMYLGAVVLFLFVMGAFYVKGHIKWWLVTSLFLVFFASMGKNFEFLNRLLFDYLPFYNKWRTPQSILSILVTFLPILGILAIHQFSLKKDKENFKKALLYSTALMGGIAAISLFIAPSMLDFSSVTDQSYANQGADVSAFINDRKTLLRRDSLRTLALVLGAAGLLYLFMQGKMKKIWLMAGLFVLVMVDFIGVKSRYLTAKDYVKKEDAEQFYQPRNVDSEILSREPSRELYRVQDATIDWRNNASTSYYHNTIGGYDPVKLQRYEDLVSGYLVSGNMNVFNMLNAKYFIVPGQNNEPEVNLNSRALGNAWFVDKITTVDTPNEEYEYLENLDPAREAVVRDKEFNQYIGNFDPVLDTNGTISMQEYTPDRIVYSSQADSEQMAVFSEIWFDHDSWKSYIDGAEVPHVRVNYALRGMRIPAGQHKIEFSFEPSCVVDGERIAFISSLLILFLLGYVVYERYRGKQDPLEFANPMDFYVQLKESKPGAKDKVKKKKPKSASTDTTKPKKKKK